jgi:hypothetical protein
MNQVRKDNFRNEVDVSNINMKSKIISIQSEYL